MHPRRCGRWCLECASVVGGDLASWTYCGGGVGSGYVGYLLERRLYVVSDFGSNSCRTGSAGSRLLLAYRLAGRSRKEGIAKEMKEYRDWFILGMAVANGEGEYFRLTDASNSGIQLFRGASQRDSK